MPSFWESHTLELIRMRLIVINVYSYTKFANTDSEMRVRITFKLFKVITMNVWRGEDGDGDDDNADESNYISSGFI